MLITLAITTMAKDLIAKTISDQKSPEILNWSLHDQDRGEDWPEAASR